MTCSSLNAVGIVTEILCTTQLPFEAQWSSLSFQVLIWQLHSRTTQYLKAEEDRCQQLLCVKCILRNALPLHLACKGSVTYRFLHETSLRRHSHEPTPTPLRHAATFLVEKWICDANLKQLLFPADQNYVRKHLPSTGHLRCTIGRWCSCFQSWQCVCEAFHSARSCTIVPLKPLLSSYLFQRAVISIYSEKN